MFSIFGRADPIPCRTLLTAGELGFGGLTLANNNACGVSWDAECIFGSMRNPLN